MNKPLTAGERPVRPSSPRDNPRKPRRRGGVLAWIGRLASVGAALVALLVVVGGLAGYAVYRHIASDLPSVDGLLSYQPRLMSRVFAGNGALVAELATERRIFVPSAEIPDLVKEAFVSAEDKNFYTHRGVDPLAILRAAVTDVGRVSQGKRPIGASTITQQVAKNMLLDSEVTLSRKIKEAILAIRIEDTLSKDRILELYLNEIYLGLGSYGIAAAAQTYFNKPLDQLDAGEAAFLAALPKAPNNYNPFKYPKAARDRRDWVLDRMVDDRAITQAEADAAKAQPIVAAQFHRAEPPPGSAWFAEEVRRRLTERFGADTTMQGGLMVRTSLDPALQAVARASLRDGLTAYDRKRGGWRGPVGHVDAPGGDWAATLAQQPHPPGMRPAWRLALVIDETDAEARVGWLADNPAQPPRTSVIALSDLGWARPVVAGKPGAAPHRMADIVRPGDLVMVEPAGARARLEQIPSVQGALVSLDPTTGRVLAMVGGWSSQISQFNRATQADRQPGSSFKPFVYLTALEQGISPSQRFLDAPFVLQQGAEGPWRPGNYELTFNGPTPMRIALEKSLNLVTLRIAHKIGIDAVAKTAIAFHEFDAMPRVLAAALGTVDTTVLREAGAYASLAAGGREVIPSLIDSVQDRDGHVVWRAPGRNCESCADPAAPPEPVDARTQIADAASDFQLVTMMQGVVQRGTGVAAGAGLGRPIAGKTGTTQDFNDAWFAGFTPDLVTVVWVGYDTPQSLGDNETGAAVAIPIWHAFMAHALKTRPVLSFPVPPGVALATWNSPSGPTTDAFKPDQVPGASAALDGTGVAQADGGAAAGPDGGPAAPSAPAGVDGGLGGLY